MMMSSVLNCFKCAFQRMGRPLQNVVNDGSQVLTGNSNNSIVHGKKLQECAESVPAQLAVSK